MNIKMLDKKFHIDEKRGCLCRYVRSDTEHFRPHYHNYYEIFMVLSGNVCHIANSKEYNLIPRQLLFIRDFDIHDYKSVDGKPFEFVNLAFAKENFEDMAHYLGDKFPSKELLGAELPPSVLLSERDKDKIFYSMTELSGAAEDSETTKIRLRALLLNIFMQYFFDYKENKSEVPLWLEMTCDKMRKPANFIKGTQRFYEICPKSREHLCRSLKKYYGTTVHEFLNDLKLDYCINLLVASNISVMDICYECGFENVSWFYRVFQKKFGMTPSEFRKRNK